MTSSNDLEIPRELYESEISFTISCIWENGFDLALGLAPEFNETGHVKTYLEVCRWLKEAALRHYPNSVFARKHGGRDGNHGSGTGVV